jgi:hypothetical protein
MSITPTPADKFAFGLWTIGWVGQDQFGSASRAPSDVAELAQPTLHHGETYADLLADPSAYEDFDAEPYFNRRGFGLRKASTVHARAPHGCPELTRAPASPKSRFNTSERSTHHE